jgi:type I restriction enzyme S subunit
MKKKATARPAKSSSRQSTLNFPTSSEADLVAESTAAETSTKSGAKNRRKRTADFADDADKHNESHCDSSAISAQSAVKKSSTDFDDELARLPKGWRWVTLREIADISGGITKGQKYRETDILRRVPYLRVANVQRGYLDLSEMKEIDATETKIAALQLQPGDILFNEGGDRDKLGRGWIWNNELSVCIHQNHVFRARLRNTEHSPRFVSYYSNSAGQQYFYDQGKHTTNLASINLTKLGDLPIPLPPPAEQHRIVAEIEKQFTRLDAGVAALKRVQANLKRYRAAVLKAACEGKLVPTEAELRRTADYADIADKKVRPSASSSKSAVKTPSFETGEQLLQRILTERRQNWQGRGQYKEPEAPGVAKLSVIPDSWAWASVEQLGDVQLGRQRSPKNVAKDYPTQYIRAANITERGIDVSDVLEMEFSPAERERFALRNGDIVLSEASGSPSQVGKPAIWQNELPLCCFQNTVLRLRPVVVESRFVLLVFRNCYMNGAFAKVAGGVGINHLGAEKFSAVPFPLPPLAEQTRIVAEVERRLSVVDGLEAVVSANLQRANRLRQSILQKAFTGELTGDGTCLRDSQAQQVGS